MLPSPPSPPLSTTATEAIGNDTCGVHARSIHCVPLTGREEPRSGTRRAHGPFLDCGRCDALDDVGRIYRLTGWYDIAASGYIPRTTALPLHVARVSERRGTFGVLGASKA